MGFEEVCRSHNNCITGNCVGGICKKTSANSRCRDDDKDTCPTGYHCNDKKKCIRNDPTSRPTACKKNADCGSSEVCLGSICQDKEVGLGQNCGGGVKCDDDLYCFNGYCVKNCEEDADCEDKFLCKLATTKRKGACLFKPRETNSNDTKDTKDAKDTKDQQVIQTGEKSWISQYGVWVFSGAAVSAIIIALLVVLILKKSNRPSYTTTA